MPSPFPGMDPYLESQGCWQDFHATLLDLIVDGAQGDIAEELRGFIEERISSG